MTQYRIKSKKEKQRVHEIKKGKHKETGKI